jgi:putative peptidoglycan lipid II flippase
MTAVSDVTAPPRATLAGDSSAVAVWTVVSRVTGFLRIALIGAVLGPTFLGNLFLAINSLPNLAMQFLGGSLIGSVLIPSLVPSIDRRERKTTGDMAGGFLGAAVVGLGAVAVVGAIAAPVVLSILSAGIQDRQVAADQLSSGWILMALTMPQLPLYGVALIGGAVMNAHGRFALAAAAPVAENVGVMATMAVVALAFGTGHGIHAAGVDELLLLGLGSTLAVGLHAGVMLWGARRTGTRLVPRRGWRMPAVRRLLGRMTASFGQTGMTSARFFAMLSVANSVPAGVVAYQMAINFLYLPVQVGGRPISLAMMPTLSRLYDAGRAQAFRNEYAHGTALIGFLTLPAAVAYLVLAGSFGRAVSFGEMAGSTAPGLIAACLAGLAVAVPAESAFQQATYASYARHDARSPFVATIVGTAASLVVLAAALAVDDGRIVLLIVGLAFSAGSAASAVALHRRLAGQLPASEHYARGSLRRTLGASAIMAGPALAASVLVSRVLDGPLAGIVGVVAAATVGGLVFVGVQRLWHSPELSFFAHGLRRLRPHDL